ncbi:hypothetical protein AB0N50_07955 [Streptomyces pharetrae]|jgi:hypothetical protein|uniref:hypothetical protein n=1 Tax=Streptomyces pharetrae TaxID=291370 RepID=UPI0034611AF2
MTDEQRKADLERASNQNSFADLARTVEHSDGNGVLTRWVIDPVRAVVGSTSQGKAVFGSTDFAAKNLDLNEMIELVEQTDPEDLESSGNALLDARTAIADAATTLSSDFAGVPWVGEAGEAFRRWGERLVKGTTELSEFAGKAGDQLVAASMGLASVRKAMPARDPKNLKRPENFTDAEKAAKKDDYDAAVKVEKDRQEAINQMNRLASYYAVSSQQLAALQEKPPTFGEVPTAGMPKPSRTAGFDSGAGAHGSAGERSVAGPARHAPVESAGRTEVQGSVDRTIPPTIPDGKVEYPDDAVGTNIDSVGTLPPTTTTPPVTGHTPPVNGTPPMTGGQSGPYENYAPSVPNRTPGRATGGTSGPRLPATAQGRTQPGLANPVTGRSTGPGATNQLGRPTATGQPVARGTGSGAKPFPMGPSGVSGGTPRPGGTAAPRAASGPATGAGRANGVVGGRPTPPGGAAAKSGPRIPRGTVIGSAPTSNARPATGGPGQRGVFGAPSQASARPGAGAGSASRGGTTGGSKPVTASPTGRNSAVQAERNGMTRGGAGLARKAGGKDKAGDEREARETQSPDRVAEGEETHRPNQSRRDVPPVVN